MENHQFKLIYSPGLEDLGILELKEKWKLLFNEELPLFERSKGVVSLETTYEKGVMLCHYLKIPSKIFLKVASFKCRDLPKLFNKIKKINWKPYLYREEIHFDVTSKKSRLINTKKIEETLKEAFKQYFNANHLKEKIIEEHKNLPPPHLVVRLVDDELTLQLNISGDLHKRGEGEYRGIAGLRETYASALLYYLKNHSKASKLIDPMCGSGTFLFEAKNFYSPTQKDFPYLHTSRQQREELPPKLFQEFYGRDIYKKNIEMLKEQKDFHIELDNIFKATKRIPNGAVIINAPYGKRVKLDDSPENYYPKLASAVLENYTPDAFAFLIPRPSKKTFLRLKDLSFKEVLRFNNNSIDVSLFFYLK